MSALIVSIPCIKQFIE
ncbi:Protein of unknown function [Bacillus cereus]|nr:Protein of unknown function [Bacillus wiedmannii]SCM98913.1 Protein of unknown function [Bacillus cereus]SCN37007.1 Protein of unknown function [Bacillus wiedmannii]